MRSYQSPTKKGPSIIRKSAQMKRVGPQQTITSTTSITSQNELNGLRPQKNFYNQPQNNAVSYKSENRGSLMENNVSSNKRVANDHQRFQKANYTFKNGDSYKGQWRKDISGAEVPDGYGCYTFKAQNIQYRGDFRNGKMHGQGLLQRLVSNGKPQIIYDGEWMEGNKNGTGKYYYDDRTYYYGDWNRNRKQGKGQFVCSKANYTGDWLQNKMHGTGKLTLSNGNIYQGKFNSDQFVSGSVKYTNNDSYKGDSKNWDRQGHGQYVSGNNEQIYKGPWRASKKDGPGQIFYKNREQYQGLLSMDVRSGPNGTYHWPTGEKINADFIDNVPLRGSMSLPDNTSFNFDMSIAPKAGY